MDKPEVTVSIPLSWDTDGVKHMKVLGPSERPDRYGTKQTCFSIHCWISNSNPSEADPPDIEIRLMLSDIVTLKNAFAAVQLAAYGK